MLERILTPEQQALVAEVRRALADARALLVRTGIEETAERPLAASLEQLDELFLLVVVGEFNAGKSAFINALLGTALLETGVTPTTSRVTLLRHGEAVSRSSSAAGLETISAPAPLLLETSLVDTPGTNAVLREHETLTRDFVPRSDLVLFVTSADRPFTESERQFLQSIREWGKKVVVAVNKADILEAPHDVESVRGFVSGQAQRLLGFQPEVFAVSARQALRAKTAAPPDAEALAASGFPALERHIAATLDEAGRLRLKLLNPLGVCGRLVAQQLQALEAQRSLIAADLTALDEIDAQLALYAEDLGRDFRFRLAGVENVLYDFEKRGEAFFEETLRLGRVFDLMNRARVKADFEKRVVADLPQLVERRVEETIDWMIASEQRQWKAVMETLERRQQAHRDRLVGRLEPGFERDRARLLESSRREAQRALEGYDHEAESTRLAGAVRDAVASTAILQVGALGLGTLVTLLASTTLADVTGLLAAGALSLIGLLAIPHRRRRARRELNEKAAALRRRLMEALTAEFEREKQHSLARIRETIAPYTRFVRGERERLAGLQQGLTAQRDLLGGLRQRVESLR